MSTLVKSSDGALQGRIRTFRRSSSAGDTAAQARRYDADASGGSTQTQMPRSVDSTPLNAPGHTRGAPSETEALLARIDALEAELERARDEAELQREANFEEGRAAGLQEAESAEAERLEMLGQAAAKLAGRMDEACKSAETLGTAIAGVAIGKVLGDKEIYRQAIADCIARQMEAIRPELVNVLRLSAADFPDETAVSQLAAQHGVQMELDPQLEPGTCLFDLSLGRLDASLGRQRDTIVALLDELAGGQASK